MRLVVRLQEDEKKIDTIVGVVETDDDMFSFLEGEEVEDYPTLFMSIPLEDETTISVNP